MKCFDYAQHRYFALGQYKNIVYSIVVIFTVLLLFQCSDMNNDDSGPAYIGMSLPADFQVFSSDSPWNTPIGNSPAIHPDSDLKINTLVQGYINLGKPARININYTMWTASLHVIDYSRSPLVSITTTSSSLDLYGSVDPDYDGTAHNIPMPVGVWPDPENDGHMILVDPYLKITWEFSKAYIDGNGNWRASIIDKWDLTSQGYREPFTGKRWWRGGARGSGVPYIAGLIRLEEIKGGVINHALAVAASFNGISSTIDPSITELISPVASRSDARHSYTGERLEGPQYILEGARLQLDPALDLDSLGLTSEGRIIAKALQDYGAYLVDISDNFVIYLQNLGSDGGEWNDYIDSIKSIYNIPLDKFRVLDYGQNVIN